MIVAIVAAFMRPGHGNASDEMQSEPNEIQAMTSSALKNLAVYQVASWRFNIKRYCFCRYFFDFTFFKKAECTFFRAP
jgi:hypothetical protein